MIHGYVLGGPELIRKFREAGPRLAARLLAFVTRMTLKLQRHVKQDKLTGQVLSVRTGTLRRSITQRVETKNGVIVGLVGTNVRYAPPHEFGFQGSEQIKAHLRTIKEAFGRPLAAPRQVAVKPYTRAVNLPERSFLRSALNDMKPEIKAGLERETKVTLKELIRR